MIGRAHCETEVVGPDENYRCRRLVLAVGRLTVLQPPEEVPRLVACGKHNRVVDVRFPTSRVLVTSAASCLAAEQGNMCCTNNCWKLV